MFTIKDLLKACQEQVDLGNGDKGILISRDDEGNGYHSLCYLFTDLLKTSEIIQTRRNAYVRRRV